MKRSVFSSEFRRNIKQKLFAATALLLISAIVLGGASFAWITLSTAPEARGITTNIGANGSLEIVLLNSETKKDPDGIKASIGQTLASNVLAANNVWGNLVDLSHEGYGLGEITLLPARLNAVKQSNGGYTLNAGMLSVPTYAYDGRIIDLTDNTVSAVYKNSDFSYTLGKQDYGVRAIGTANAISVQSSALSLAKGSITTYKGNARTDATTAMKAYGSALMNIVIDKAASGNATYANNLLKGMFDSLNSAAEYVDLALRHTLIAYAASAISDEDLFVQARNTIMDESKPLSSILAEQSELDTPESFAVYLTALDDMRNDINAAKNAYSALGGTTHTGDQLRGILEMLTDLDEIFVEGKKFTEMTQSDFMALAGKAFIMKLPSGSGVFADVADFTDDYSEFFTAPLNTSVEMKTLTTQDPAYLDAVSEAVNELDAADSTGEGETVVALTQMYGYALDLAFRCNAALSSLLLQTDASQRIYEDSTAPGTMGGGSYMAFAATDVNFTLKQTVALMDAVRVAFIDDRNSILGIAKLNTSNYSVVDDTVQAPLYLYDYSFSEDPEDEGALIMGERRKFDNEIVGLEQSVAKAVTVLVWLDGDIVTNKMLSAESDTSLSGRLNLQFSSSADLVPAGNSDLLNITTDKTALNAYVAESKELYKAGQSMYTTVSWRAFTDAYENAVYVNDDMNSNDTQVLNAAKALTKARLALEEIDISVLGDAIDDMRALMGETTDPARYVLHDTVQKRYYSIASYTEEQKDSLVGTIYRVDYNNNLRDEGNGVKTAVYTDESWSNLAAALYDAELVYRWDDYTDYRAIDAALTAMETAYNALQLKVLFVPYDYNGTLYYRAITEESDTYAKWYDANFKRVFNELRIIELDTGATKAEIATILPDHISNQAKPVSVSVSLLGDIYPELKDAEILAIHWRTSESFTRAITNSQRTYLQALIGRATALGVAEDEVAAAEEVLSKEQTEETSIATQAEAEIVIAALEEKVVAEENRIAAEEATPDPDADMTANQRTLLTAAVSAAKAVKDYNDAALETLADLRSAVAAAEVILAQESGATVYEADLALDNLNTQLTENGQKAVTAYNTLLHSIPVGSEMFEPVYNVDVTNAMFLVEEGFVGNVTLGATVLIKNGVVLNVEKTVTVYAPAQGVKIVGPATDSDKNPEIKVGSSTVLNAQIIQSTALENNDYTYGESILKCTWASEDSTVLRASLSASDECTVTAVNPGETNITVTVQTDRGNVYTSSLHVTVTE